MNHAKLKVIIAGGITTAAMVLTAFGYDSFIVVIGAMSAGFLFGKAEQL